MKLAFKLAAVFLLATTLLAVGHAYYRIQHEAAIFREQTLADISKLANALDDKTLQQQLTNDVNAELLLVTSENNKQGQIITHIVELEDNNERIGPPRAPLNWLTKTAIARHDFVETRGEDGSVQLTAYWEVAVAKRPPVLLEFSRPILALEQEKQDAIHRAYWLIGSMFFLTALVSVGVGVGFVGRPLGRLIEKTRQIAAGKLDEPLELHTHDELSDLAESINGMCDALASSQKSIAEETAARIAALEQLRHSDRLQTVGRLASGMAHELGTPLNVVSGRANLIASGKLDNEQVVESANAIKLQADHMTQIIRELLDFARRGAPSRSEVDLVQLVRQTTDMLSGLTARQNIEIVTPDLDKSKTLDSDSSETAPADRAPAEPVMAHVDAGQIQQVLTNLIVNAVQAMPRGGTIHLDVYDKTAQRPDVASQGECRCHCIAVQDNGDGVESANLAKLFEPFFTTKASGVGTGLGLSIAQGIVEEHGGWIDVRSTPGEGACFIVYLPVEVAS